MGPDKDLELKKANQKISDLISQLKETKNREIMLSSEIRNLQAEIKLIEADKKSEENLSEIAHFLEEERKKLERKLELKENKIDELFQNKETLLKEKAEILASKDEILQIMTEKEIKFQQKSQKYGELREKFKRSSGDLLSKTMEIDKLRKKVQSIENVQEQHKVENLFSLENTRVITSIESVIEYIKKILPESKSSIRLVIPDIDDINKFEITEIIKKIPNKVRVNIATKIDDPIGNKFVEDIKRYCQLTNYLDKKFIALNVDSSKFLIGIFKGDDIIGIYSDILEIIDLFKSAIMEPFIKGRKVN